MHEVTGKPAPAACWARSCPRPACGRLARHPPCCCRPPALAPPLRLQDWAARTALDIARGLAHLHGECHLVHRDVSTNNVLLAPDPSDPRGFRAKLSDFGAAGRGARRPARAVMHGASGRRGLGAAVRVCRGGGVAPGRHVQGVPPAGGQLEEQDGVVSGGGAGGQDWEGAARRGIATKTRPFA